MMDAVLRKAQNKNTSFVHDYIFLEIAAGVSLFFFSLQLKTQSVI